MICVVSVVLYKTSSTSRWELAQFGSCNRFARPKAKLHKAGPLAIACHFTMRCGSLGLGFLFYILPLSSWELENPGKLKIGIWCRIFADNIGLQEARWLRLNSFFGNVTTGNYVYWANKPIPDNEVKMIDTIPYYQPRRWYDNEAYAVEATSYALLTYLRKLYWKECSPIMKWLQTMRNSYYGQASTQVTLIVETLFCHSWTVNKSWITNTKKKEYSWAVPSSSSFFWTISFSAQNWTLSTLLSQFFFSPFCQYLQHNKHFLP